MSVQAGRSGAEESQKTNSCAVKLAVPSTHCPSCNTHACKNTAATSLLLQSCCFFYLKSQHGAPTWQHWQENSISFVKWNISWILPSLFHLKPLRSGQFLVKRQGYMLCWEAHFCFKRQEKFKFNFLEKRLWLLSQCKKKKKKAFVRVIFKYCSQQSNSLPSLYIFVWLKMPKTARREIMFPTSSLAKF